MTDRTEQTGTGDAPDTQAMRDLRDELARLNRHGYLKMNSSAIRVVWYQFLRGLAFGLGSVMGATILVSIAAFWLSQIEFIPIIGEWAKQIAVEIQGELSNP